MSDKKTIKRIEKLFKQSEKEDKKLRKWAKDTLKVAKAFYVGKRTVRVVK